eukprot:g6604.t1
MAVASTRWLIQDELRIQNSQCDNCILTTMILLQQLACICRIAAMISGNETIENIADLLSFAAEVMWWTVCACTQTQHKIQLDDRDCTGGGAYAGQGVTTQPPMPQPAPPYGTYPAPVQPGPPGYPPGPGYPTAGYGYQQPPPAGYQQPPPGYPAAQPPGYNPQMYR